MNTRKKISFSLCVVCFLLTQFPTQALGKHHHTHSQKNPADTCANADTADIFGPEEIDPLDDPTITRYVQDKTFRTPGQTCTAQNILNLLVPAGVSTLLEGNLFCHTNPLNTRNLDDEPLFLPHVFQYPQDITVSTCLFWNQTPKMNFTAASSSIDSYLALCNPALLATLQNLQQKIQIAFPDFPDYDLARILGIFSTGHIEERRIGTSLQALWQSPFGDLRLFVPIYYGERNFNLGDAELADLAAQTFEPSPGEQERFKKDHLISDAINFGDLRIEWLLPLIDRETFALKTGIYSTLPTTWALATDIKGSTYCPDAPRPKLNLVSLCQNHDVKSINQFLSQTLNHLSANLIDIQQNYQQRHFSIAGMVQTKATLGSLIHRPWADHFSLHGRTSLEYFTPGWEKRFYVLSANPADFVRFDQYKNGQGGSATAPEDLAFLEKRLVDVVYPYVFDTMVKPNFVFWWNTKAQYEYESIGGFLGLDFWLKGKEQFGRIKGLPSVCTSIQACKAQKPLAYQLKVLGSLFFTIDQPSYSCIISLNADKTVLRSGIGKDYTLTLQFETSF